MLAVAISLLFGFATFAALAVIHASLVAGARRARLILAELAEIERAAGAPLTLSRNSRPAAPWRLAAA